MSTPLTLRRQTINRLLALYTQREQTKTEAQRVLLSTRIIPLENTLFALNRRLGRVSLGLTKADRFNHKTPQAPDEKQSIYAVDDSLAAERFTLSEIDQLFSRAGIQAIDNALQAWVNALFEAIQLLRELQQSNAAGKASLGLHNPFRLPDTTEAFLMRGFPEGTASLTEFVQQQEAIARQYSEGGSLNGLLTPLPLYRHVRELEAWMAVERSRQNFRQPWNRSQTLAQFITDRFNQQDSLRVWQRVKYLARTIDQRETALQNQPLFEWAPEGPITPARHMPDSTGVTNTLGVIPVSAIPRFVNEQGDALAHTQVLCWRYKKDNSAQLAAMHMDRLSPNLTTVGLLFTDHDGVPSLTKPRFLRQPDHEITLQVQPTAPDGKPAQSTDKKHSADILLLETTRAERPDELVPDDPLIASWFSYGLPEHLANINQAIALVGGQPVPDARRLHSPNSLSGVGFPLETRLTEYIGNTDLTGFFELAEGYEYGFMVLPLGHGSVAIRDLAGLPERHCDGRAIAIRQRMTDGQQNVTLPRTLRQFTHECYQARNGLYIEQQNMMQANAYKLEDIARLEKLKAWMNYNTDYPAQSKRRLNRPACDDLDSELTKLQAGIRQSQFIEAANSQLNDPNDAAKYHIYLKQQASATAFTRYSYWVNTGMALLDEVEMMKRAGLWSRAQAECESTLLDRSASQFVTVAEQLANPAGRRNERLESLYWQPPKTQLPDMESPYTPLVYDAVTGVISLLARSHKDEELFGRLLLPAVHSWLSAPEIKELSKQVSGKLLLVGDRFGAKTLDLPEEKSTSQLKATQSPLEWLLGGTGADAAVMTFGVTKSTFLRGPGAPALMEGILQLSSMLLPTAYHPGVQSQMNALLRGEMLMLLRHSNMHVQRHSEQLSELMALIHRGEQRLKLRSLLHPEALYARVYGGDTWGTSHMQSRVEGGIKTVLFFVTKGLQIADFMQHMDEDQWANPSDDDFRNAAYQYLNTVDTWLNEGSALLATPQMIKFLSNIKGSMTGYNVRQTLVQLFERQLFSHAEKGAEIVFGSTRQARLAGWLLGAKDGVLVNSVSSVMGAWANRLSFAAAATAFVTTSADVVRHLSHNREYDALRDAVEALGYGMVAAGGLISAVAESTLLMTAISCNALPVVGQALFVGGTVISIGLIAWDFYWKHWGRAHFYSDTFVVFDDQWRAMSDAAYFNEYIEAAYGATPATIEAYNAINDKYQNSVIDQMKYSIHVDAIAKSNGDLVIANAMARLLNMKEAELLSFPIHSSREKWKNFNWLVSARLLAHQDFLLDSNGELQADNVNKTIDISRFDIDLAFRLSGTDWPEKDSDAEPLAKTHLYNALKTLQDISLAYYQGKDNSEAAVITAEVLWPALVSGTYPEQLPLEELKKAKYPTTNPETIDLFLQRWKTLVD